MVYASISALVVFIIFMAYIGFIWFVPALELFVNGIILYALFLRSHVEIIKEKKHGYYLAGAAASMIVFTFMGSFLRSIFVWGITEFMMLAFIFAQAGIISHQIHKNRRKSGK